MSQSRPASSSWLVCVSRDVVFLNAKEAGGAHDVCASI